MAAKAVADWLEVRALPGRNNSQPPIAWRYSGNQMKRWRTKANITREQLAAAANYPLDTIASMEQASACRRPGSSTWRTSCAGRRGR